MVYAIVSLLACYVMWQLVQYMDRAQKQDSASPYKRERREKGWTTRDSKEI
jgi:hypothetical protein